MAMGVGALERVAGYRSEATLGLRRSVQPFRRTAVRPSLVRCTAQKDHRAHQPSAAVLLAASTVLLAEYPAHAQGEIVDAAVNSAIDIVKATGSLAKSGLGAALSGVQYLKEAYDRASPTLNEVSNTVTPYVKSGLQTASTYTKPALEAAEPYVQSTVREVEQFLSAQGLNARVVVEGANKAGDVAKGAATTAAPVVESTLSRISVTEPGVLAQYALGLATLYFLGPALVRGVFGGLRGYAGNISAAAALDAVSADGNTVIVDLRSQREKENAGVPDLPNAGRLVELEYAAINDRKIRSQLRNPADIEKQVTVLEIAALKRVGKGTRIMLLDRNGSASKTIAKALSGRGFKKVYVVQGGFSGWTSSKLQTKYTSSVSAVEVLSPGNIFGTIRNASKSSSGRLGSNKLLPSGR